MSIKIKVGGKNIPIIRFSEATRNAIEEEAKIVQTFPVGSEFRLGGTRTIRIVVKDKDSFMILEPDYNLIWDDGRSWPCSNHKAITDEELDKCIDLEGWKFVGVHGARPAII